MDQAQKNLDGGALARAILAENSGDPVGNGEADVVERDDVPIPLAQVLGGEQDFSGGHQAPLPGGQAAA
jgi:hypothetical protein